MRTTPMMIQTMLHIYGCPQPLRDVPAVAQSLNRLNDNGLIEEFDMPKESCGYRCTDRGLAWINMLLETPLPTAAFLDPRNNEAVSVEFRDIGPGIPTPIMGEVEPSAADLF